MKNKFLPFLIVFQIFFLINLSGQIKSKVWYDGNARVMYDRDMLLGSDLDKRDTISSRNNGKGFTKIDLGIHFTPIKDIEIFSEIRLQNDFGGMWGNRNLVNLRSLSAKGVINDRVKFSVGDIMLKQSKFTLYNYHQDLSKNEPSVFNFYNEYVNYENYYYENYWRLQGIQTNFSYNMYNYIEQIDIDAFTTRVRGAQWLGKPELLMTGATTFIRINEKLKFGSNYINTFEIASSSNTDIAYYNPVLSSKIIFTENINNLPFKFFIEGGLSKRGWNGDNNAPELNGKFITSSLKFTKNQISKYFISLNYVDSDFRSIGAQTRRIQYLSNPISYPYYNNNYVQRKVTLLDILTDPSIYNQKLATSLMNYNPIYNSTLPYGDATPNRVGIKLGIEDATVLNYILSSSSLNFYSEVRGQGTTQKRQFFVLNSFHKVMINEMLNFSFPLILEVSVNNENVKRGGDNIEEIKLNNLLYSSGITVGINNNLHLIFGAKFFSSKGNEYLADRNIYDEIIDYDAVNYDNNETILTTGLQYSFSKDIYITTQYNYFNVLDNNNLEDEFSMGRFIFMFNMNL